MVLWIIRPIKLIWRTKANKINQLQLINKKETSLSLKKLIKVTYLIVRISKVIKRIKSTSNNRIPAKIRISSINCRLKLTMLATNNN